MSDGVNFNQWPKKIKEKKLKLLTCYRHLTYLALL